MHSHQWQMSIGEKVLLLLMEYLQQQWQVTQVASLLHVVLL